VEEEVAVAVAIVVDTAAATTVAAVRTTAKSRADFFKKRPGVFRAVFFLKRLSPKKVNGLPTSRFERP